MFFHYRRRKGTSKIGLGPAAALIAILVAAPVSGRAVNVLKLERNTKSGMPQNPEALLPAPSSEAILAMLAKAMYDELEFELEQYRLVFQWDISAGEQNLVRAYAPFSSKDSLVKSRLDAWVEARPSSYQALAARANCYVTLASEARGGAWAKDTSTEQFHLMEKLYDLARKDAMASIKIQPKNIVPHRTMVSMAKSGRPAELLKAAGAALDVYPASFSIRLHTIIGLQPRWGGSYEAIEAFARQSQKYASQNPRLRHLLGYAYWARAEDLMSDKRYQEAYEAYSQAIIAGDGFQDLYVDRSRAAKALENYPQAIRDVETAMALGPWEKSRQELRDDAVRWVHKRYVAGDLEAIGETLVALAAARPDDAEVLAYRGATRCRLNEVDSALKDLGRSIELDATNYRVRVERNQCLVRHGRSREGVVQQQLYVLDHPGDGLARQDLAWLYSEAGDGYSAHLALLAACDAGNKESCLTLNRPPFKEEGARIDWNKAAQRNLKSAGEVRAYLEGLEKDGRFKSYPKKALKKVGPPNRKAGIAHSYPSWAVAEAKQGWVDVQLFVNADGSMAGVKALKSEPEGYFELPAIDSALTWRYEPVITDEGPVAWTGVQRMSFKLEKQVAAKP